MILRKSSLKTSQCKNNDKHIAFSRMQSQETCRKLQSYQIKLLYSSDKQRILKAANQKCKQEDKESSVIGVLKEK